MSSLAVTDGNIMLIEYDATIVFFAHVKKEKKKRLYNYFAFYANLFLV